MRILRFLSKCLALVAVLAVLLAAIAITPTVQTWMAQLVLARKPALQGSLDWITARFGKVEISNLRLNLNGAVLTVPSFQARLPLVAALWSRHLAFRSVVAKGWKLDLGRFPANAGGAGAAGSPATPNPAPDATAPPPEPAPTSQPAPEVAPQPAPASAEDVARLFLGALSQLKLPCGVSLDDVDLEGDVLWTATTGGGPAPVHVVIKGGGMAVGREGAFAFDAATAVLDAKDQVMTLAAHGRLLTAMGTPRTFNRVEVKADLTADGGPLPNSVTLSADVADTVSAGAESYSLDVNRGDRHLAAFVFRFLEASGRLAGTWKVDLADSDVALFAPTLALPGFAAKGDGQFDTDLAFATVHGSGRLNAALSRLSVVAPILSRLEPATLETEFDLTQSGQSLHVDRLTAAVTGAGPAAVARALQSFDFDEATGELKPLHPADEWVDLLLRGIPPDWLSGLAGGLTLSGGGAAGEFMLRTEKGKFSLRSKGPLTAAGVAVDYEGRTIGRKLDLSLLLAAENGPDGWTIRAEPVTIGSGGGAWGELKVKAFCPAGGVQPVAVTGSWKADLQSAAFQSAVPELGGIGGRSASGDFSLKLGTTTELDGKLAVAGRDKDRSLSAGGHVTVDEGGRVSFVGPVKVAFGSTVSDLSVDGTVIRGETETDLYLKLSGKTADLDQLRLVAGAVATAGGFSLPATATLVTPTSVRDKIPFWGDWAGRVTVFFDRLKAGTLTLDDIGGAFQLDHRSLRIEEGRGALAGHRFANVQGSLAFDSAAEFPYSLQAKASVEPVEVGSFFAKKDPDESPVIEGRFSMDGTVSGKGINLADLINRTREEVKLASTAGIVRVFKTDVDEAIPPDTESAAADTMGRIGSGVGKFFGVEDANRSDRKKVSSVLQSALDVINEISEIGYDQCTVTLVRGTDRTIHLVDLAMTAGDEHITGSGQVTYVEGRPIRAQPLSMELHVGARGHLAKLLGAAGLLSGRKDDLGYTLLVQPLAFGGTPERIDNRQWHELLVAAARRNPPDSAQAPAGKHP